NHALPFNCQANEGLVSHAANEHAALPGGEGATTVELCSGRRNDRVPVIHRLRSAFPLGFGAFDRVTPVLDSVSGGGPTVVVAALNEVQLVTATCAMLHLPVSALGVERCRLYVAMAKRPDLRKCTVLPDERVVVRYAAIRIDSERLAQVAVHPLGVRTHGCHGALSHGHVQLAVRPECQPGPEVQLTIEGGHRMEDYRYLLQRTSVCRQHSTRYAGGIATLPRLRKGPVDGAIRFEGGAECHIQEPALPSGVHFRQAPKRLPNRAGC